MGDRRRARYRRRAKARGPRKPGYAEVAFCSAQMSPKGPHGGVVWQPISGFLEQAKNFAAEHGATLGKFMETRTHDAIYDFKRRGLVLVDYKTNMMRMTGKGNDLIRDVLAEIDESGETFATDLERFYSACALFKKALRPLKRFTKAELVSKLEILLGSPRTRDGNDSDTESDGTDTDSIMEDADEAIIPDTPSTPEHVNNPATPPHRVFGRPDLDLRAADPIGDPRFAYPSPESAARPPLGPQRSLYYTPPPSPTRGAGPSDVLMEDEAEQAMDIDDNSLDSQGPSASEDLQQTIINLRQNIETLTAELNNAKASRRELEDAVETLQTQSSGSEVMRNNLQSQITELENKKRTDASRILTLDESIQRGLAEYQRLGGEMAQLRVEMGDMAAMNIQLRGQILNYQDKLDRVTKICAE